MKKENGVVSFLVDNHIRKNGNPQREKEAQRSGNMQGGAVVKNRWKTLKIVYNSSRTEYSVSLDEDGWTILCDGQDSRLWESDHPAVGEIKAAPQSVLVLGRKKAI